MNPPEEPSSPPPKPKLLGGHRPERFARTLAIAVVLGLVGGLVTVGFIRALEAIKELLWQDLPEALDVSSTEWWFVVAVVLTGSVLLGLARRWLGEYPVSLEQAIADHRRTGGFDDRHILQAVLISLLSLGFGAALGPEAALMAILGGLGTWIATVNRANTAERSDLSYLGVASALGALFGTAGAAALAFDPRRTDADDLRSGRIWRIVPGLMAAGAGLFVYRHLGISEHYFDLGVPDHTWAWADLAWAVPVIVVGAIGALAFVHATALAERVVAPVVDRKVLSSVLGGVVLAALASWSALVLFSGHEGVRTLLDDYGTDSSGFLVLVALAKLVAASALLATGWKGGRFFPLMFAGAALGLGLSQMVSGIEETVGLAAGMTAAVGVLLRRPVLTLLFMLWFFPATLWPVVVLAAVIGAVLGRRLLPPDDEEEPDDMGDAGTDAQGSTAS